MNNTNLTPQQSHAILSLALACEAVTNQIAKMAYKEKDQMTAAVKLVKEAFPQTPEAKP